jgi:hypothetical protein
MLVRGFLVLPVWLAALCLRYAFATWLCLLIPIAWGWVGVDAVRHKMR